MAGKSSDMRVLALDPGERVGYAAADIDGLTISNLRHGITELWPMAEAVHRALEYELVPTSPGQLGDARMRRDYDVVVCEKWTLYSGMAAKFIGSSFPSVQFIGAVRLSCRLSGTKLVMQPASIKTMADRLLPQHWPEIAEMVLTPRAHDDAHDTDALRHLAYWAWRNHEPVT